MECWRRGRKKIRGDWIKKVECKGHNSLFTFISNTVTDENELKCHFRKKLKFRCQNEIETRTARGREDLRSSGVAVIVDSGCRHAVDTCFFHFMGGNSLWCAPHRPF
jgi:hypothetical protein